MPRSDRNGSHSENVVDRESYMRHEDRLHTDDHYFRYCRFLCPACDNDFVLAGFLQDLDNRIHAGNNKRTKKTIGGTIYYLCTAEYLNSPLGIIRWSPGTQTRYLAKLKELGFISIKRLGNLGRRYIAILYDNVNAAIDRVEAEHEATVNQDEIDQSERTDDEIDQIDRSSSINLRDLDRSNCAIKNKYRRSNKEKAPSRSRGGACEPRTIAERTVAQEYGDTPGPFSRNGHTVANDDDAPASKEKEWASRFLAALRDRKLITKRVNLALWSKEFASLRAAIDDDNRIERVLSWYVSYLGHLASHKIPAAYDAKGFRMTFVRIEYNMKRIEEPSRGDKKEQVID